MGEVLVRAFGYTVAARYLDNSEEMVRERYSYIEAGELGDVATEALEEIDTVDESVSQSGHSPHDSPDSEWCQSLSEKPISVCAPSQNGLFSDPPHRQSAVSVP